MTTLIAVLSVALLAIAAVATVWRMVIENRLSTTVDTLQVDRETGLLSARAVSVRATSALKRCDRFRLCLSLLVVEVPAGEVRTSGQGMALALLPGEFGARLGERQLCIVQPGSTTRHLDDLWRRVSNELPDGCAIGAATFPHDGGSFDTICASALQRSQRVGQVATP